MPEESRFLKRQDVADVLNVSPRQVHTLLLSGELRGIQVGGRGEWRIERDELERYIERQYQRAKELVEQIEPESSQLGRDDGDGVEHHDA